MRTSQIPCEMKNIIIHLYACWQAYQWQESVCLHLAAFTFGGMMVTIDSQLQKLQDLKVTHWQLAGVVLLPSSDY